MKYKVNTILYTKDGRKIGNAIIIDHEIKLDFPYQLNLVKTDYGNVVKFTDKEIEEYFYTEKGLSAEEIEYVVSEHKHAVV